MGWLVRYHTETHFETLSKETIITQTQKSVFLFTWPEDDQGSFLYPETFPNQTYLI